jgi:hypothetical protein
MVVDPVCCSSFSGTFLVDSSTVETTEIGLKNIAVMTGFGSSPRDGLEWLTSRVENWLLVFDNADDPNIDLNGFIPQCDHGNIIITSQNLGLRVYGSDSLVADLEEEDAVTLLLKSAKQPATISTRQTAADIVKVRQWSLISCSILILTFRHCAFCLLQLSKLVHSSQNPGILTAI